MSATNLLAAIPATVRHEEIYPKLNSQKLRHLAQTCAVLKKDIVSYINSFKSEPNIIKKTERLEVLFDFYRSVEDCTTLKPIDINISEFYSPLDKKIASVALPIFARLAGPKRIQDKNINDRWWIEFKILSLLTEELSKIQQMPNTPQKAEALEKIAPFFKLPASQEKEILDEAQQIKKEIAESEAFA
ncbi:MAG: hypothetical protein K1000chlam2_00327 [Chlamydiae bacterium]|nr:hypothetical protein [Chlamydiota bacterium]